MEGQRHTPSSRVLKSVSNHKAKTQELSRCPWEMLSVEEALASLEQGPPPSVEDFACILQKCRKEKIPVNALRLHAYMRKFGLEAHRSLGNYLVPMLVEAGRIHDAQEVFDRLVYQNEYSWNSLLTGYIKCGKAQHALILYQKMQVDSLHPSGYTFVAVLKACAKLKDGERGREIHTEIVRKGLERDFFVGSTLVHMYAKCGLLAKAQEVFDELPVRDAVSWTSLIAGYAKLGHGQQALNCFEQMQLEGISPNPLTFVCTLKACGSIGAVEKGQVIHAEIVRRALLEKDLLVGNAVVDMYAKCGLLAKAQEVFDKLPVRDVVSWNALTAGYAKHGGADEAFNCFEQMQVEGVSPDAVTFVCNLKACSIIGAMDKGREVHAEIAIKGFLEGDPFVGNALVDMYANCGLLAEAQEVFEKLGARDVVAWTALIAGYTKHGSGAEALSCFQQMQLSGVSPDVVTYVCSLKACSSIGATDKGQEIHAEIDRLRLLERHLNVGTALIDMYANCGLLAKAQEVFDKLPAQDVVSWNALIAGYSKHGCSKEALNCFEQMQLEGVSPDAVTLVCSLKACGSIGALDKGQEIHAEIVRQKLLERHLVVGNALVDMYASCGLLAKAQEVFDKLPVQDLVSWNVLITGYIKHGYFGEALNYFEKMQQRGVSPDAATFVCSMKACGSINAPDKCHELHAEIVRKGLLEKDLFVGIPLVEMFAQCGLLAKAQEVLYKLPVQNTVLWNALISGYANHAHGEEALNCFEHMQQEGIHPDAVTFVCSLKACGSIGASDEGQEIHAEIVRKGLLESDLLVGTALVDMYANCSLLVEAQEVFDKLLVRDVVSWNALISGYVRQGHHEEALNSFQRMNLEGISPDVITYVCSLNACGSIGAIDKGQEMHAEIFRKGLLERDLVGNALVVMYVKCGLLAKAQEVFEKISVRDVVSWNALIAGYVKHDRGEEALDCFEQMQLEGVSPDAITLVCSLKACGTIGAIDKGREMHAEIIRRGLLKRDFVTGNALVDMYVKCGLLAEAREVFDKLSLRDVVSWNALIAGNANHRCGEEGLNCFKQMQLEGVSPDAVTFICGFKACGSIGATDKGRELHSEIIKKGLLEANLIIGNALVDMHVDCGLLTEAQEVLKQLPFRDVISWTTLIAGYIKQGCSEEALSCLEQMQQEGVPSDAPLWNALIAGYAHLGQIEKAFHILDRMRGEGVKPDVDTFVSVLTACSHTGLVDKGQTCFEVMSKDYGINPTLEHYTCMVDLLGRAGQLDKAILLIKKMPFHPNLVAWHTLLGACRKWGNVVLGRRAFESALGLDEKDAAAYICMSNIYADNDMQEDVNMVWAMEETIT